MRDMLNRRLSFIGLILLIAVGLVVYRLISIQFGIDSAYFTEIAIREYRSQTTIRPPRGEVYDRNGVLLATNAVEYEVGMSPILIYDREGTADQLAEIMGLDREQLLRDMARPDPYIQLARPAPALVGQRLLEADLDGIVIAPLTRRYYPHGAVAAHVLGFVGYDEVGYYGIEDYYDRVLVGKASVDDQSRIPFEATGGEGWQRGSDLYLTIDSEVQFLAEEMLAIGLERYGATSGTILIMNPRTGEILAMASQPDFDPNRFFTADPEVFDNPAISQQYEPGSVVKVLTMAIALENGEVEPDSTYTDEGMITVGGQDFYNWDRAAHGLTSMTELLGKSLNVGAARLSLAIGPTKFYAGLEAFGFGQPTGIDLQGEIAGQLRKPGSADWYESDLAANAFGQGVAVTPLQRTTAIAAVANDGIIMQPHMVRQRVDPDGTVTIYEPTALGRAISSETARALNQMLANALQQEASSALVPGYTVAGKTGTAEIPIPGGYDPVRTIASFVGYGPVDDPQLIVLIKLDHPTASRWGSHTAAPLFSELAGRLVVLLEIPPDNVRVTTGN